MPCGNVASPPRRPLTSASDRPPHSQPVQVARPSPAFAVLSPCFLGTPCPEGLCITPLRPSSHPKAPRSQRPGSLARGRES